MADPGDQSGTPLWRRPAVLRLLVVSLLGFSGFSLTLASLPLWAVEGGTSASAAGLVTTVMLASTVATQTAVPWLLERFGTGPTFVGGLVALGAPAPLLVLTTDLGPLLLISALRGTGFAVLTVVGAILTVSVAPPGRHGETVGLYGLAIAVPNMVGVPLGVALTQAGAFGWVAVFAATPLAAVPVALALTRARGDRGPSSDTEVGSHRATLMAVLAPSLVLLAVTLAGGGLLTFLPIARPTGALAALALFVFGLIAAVGRWRVGILADRVGTTFLLPGTLFASVAGMVLVAVGLLQESAALILLGAALFGAGYGAVQNLTLLVAFARAGPGRTNTASSAWNAAFDAGTGAGAGTIGALAALGLGLPGAFVVSAALMAATLPLTVVRERNRRRDRWGPG